MRHMDGDRERGRGMEGTRLDREEEMMEKPW